METLARNWWKVTEVIETASIFVPFWCMLRDQEESERDLFLLCGTLSTWPWGTVWSFSLSLVLCSRWVWTGYTAPAKYTCRTSGCQAFEKDFYISFLLWHNLPVINCIHVQLCQPETSTTIKTQHIFITPHQSLWCSFVVHPYFCPQFQATSDLLFVTIGIF